MDEILNLWPRFSFDSYRILEFEAMSTCWPNVHCPFKKESKNTKENINRKRLNDLSTPSNSPYSSASYVNNEFRFNKLIPRHNSRSFKNAIPDYPVDAPPNTFFDNPKIEDANSIRKTRKSPNSESQTPGGYISPHTIHYGGFQPIDDKPQDFDQRLFTTPIPDLIANNKFFDIRNEVFTSYDEFKDKSQDVIWAPIFGNKVTPQPVIKTESTPTIFSQIIQETSIPTVTKTFPQTTNGFFTTTSPPRTRIVTTPQTTTWISTQDQSKQRPNPIIVSKSSPKISHQVFRPTPLTSRQAFPKRINTFFRTTSSPKSPIIQTTTWPPTQNPRVNFQITTPGSFAKFTQNSEFNDQFVQTEPKPKDSTFQRLQEFKLSFPDFSIDNILDTFADVPDFSLDEFLKTFAEVGNLPVVSTVGPSITGLLPALEPPGTRNQFPDLSIPIYSPETEPRPIESQPDKKPVLTCTHKEKTECHDSYLTLFEPSTEEKCDEHFNKKCTISFKKSPTSEMVRKCYTPTRKVCNGQGPEVCKTIYETSCTTKYVKITSGDVVGDTRCKKLPVKICGRGCITQSAAEECHEKKVNSLVDVPEEMCDITPQKTCTMVTKLVPNLKPKQECSKVPHEVCELKYVQ